MVTPILPPGVTAARFAAALAELERALGKPFVLTGDEALGPYRDPWSLRWGEADEYRASAAVLPQTVEEVQAVVRIANAYLLPLHPISTGKNQTFGGAAPGLSGSVVVDLKRMNRILAVDEKRAFCLVEPGVTYFDLYRHIQDHGVKLMLDVPDTGWGSMVGNALERGVGYTVSGFRDHFGSHCGLEAVLPTGEVMRTGMGALPGSDTWQDFRYGAGPSVDGLFAQGNFGIVTKMGFWLMPQPEAWGTAFVDVRSYGDLAVLVDEINALEDAGIINGKPQFNGPPYHPFEGTFPSAAPKSDLAVLMANGWPPYEEIADHAWRHGGPAWWCNIHCFGPEGVVRASFDHARERLKKALPGVTFRDYEVHALPLQPEVARRFSQTLFGIPNLHVFERSPAEAAAAELHAPVQGFVDFQAVIPRTGAAVLKAQRVLYETQKQMGAPPATTPFNAPISWYHRTFLMGAPTVAVYHGDPEQNRKGRALYEAYVKAMSAAGFGVYRTSPAMQDLVAAQYSFGGHALLRFQERLKDAADPNGVMAPGRYGVWPKRLRKA
jgi:4-cresol dehydrogenase (hydroxylating)